LPEDEISEFSEFLFRNGSALIQQKAFFEGFQQIQRAVELVPNHTPALKYLGATYLYSLEHYQKALESYDLAIGVDPLDVDALLGKAVSLHYLGKNLESNSILAEMFQPDKARWEILDREQTVYFRGQGYYFQAYNDYLLGSRKSARKLVDLALQYQPDEDGPHYLSGVLYFEDQEFEKAQGEFLEVITNGTSLCDAYFKLGKIRVFEESIKALEFFEANRYCLETTIRNQDQKIIEISGLRLDPKTKREIIQSLQERKGNYVDQGIASAFNMISGAKKLEGVGVEEFLSSMENFWQRLATLKETGSQIE
jgi:tetratricopeptide (TPR) repeat protein